jgi:hypothetical protein
MSSIHDEIIAALKDAESVLGNQRIHAGSATREGYLVTDRVSSAINLVEELAKVAEGVAPIVEAIAEVL